MGNGFGVQLYRPGDDKVAALLMEQGRIAAQRAAASGQIWGNAISNVGQAAGQAVQQYGEQKQLKKQDQAFMDLLQQSEGTPDPKRILGIYGPQRGMHIVEGLAALDQVSQKRGVEALQHAPAVLRGYEALSPEMRAMAWPKIRQTAIAAGLSDGSLPEHRSDELDNQVIAWGKGLSGPKEAPKTREIKVRNADGSESIQIVEDKAGQNFTSAAAPQKPESRSIEEQLAEAKLAGDTKRYAQLLRVKSEAAFAGRAPKEAPQPHWQQGEDANGDPILYDAATGAVKPFPSGVTPKAGAAEAGRIAGAKAALEASSEIKQYLTKPEVRKAIGPLMGRYNSLMQAAGEGDPVATELVGMLKSYSAMQPNIHGFRAVHFASDIEKLLTTKQTPENLEAALRGIDTAAIYVRDRGRHPAGATESGPKQIKTDADYNSLASGSEFIDPEGKRRRKP